MEYDQNEVIALLSDPARHMPPAASVERIDTHGAIVFLAGEYAYKLKRAIKLPYLDFSTLDKREAVCRNELARNRHTAPALYVGVRPVVRRHDGEFAIGSAANEGADEVVDWLIVMKRFPQDQLLDTLAERGALPISVMMPLSLEIATYHREAAAHENVDGHAIMERVLTQTLERLGASDVPLAGARLDALSARALDQLETHSELLSRRSRDGFVRLCHGDLHLKNIVMLDGRPTLFDAIEFDDSLATIDVLYDLAFLLMDLWHRGLGRHANVSLGSYASAAMTTEDLDGLSLLPLFLAARAAIRAVVTLDKLAVEDKHAHREVDLATFEEYVSMAERFLVPHAPALIAVGGLSGTGKSTLAAGLAPSFGAAPGALHLRSDVERKRMWGADPLTPLPEAAYSEDVSEKVYARVCERAERALAAGHCVVADAVFMDPAHRAAIEGVAEHAGVPFTGIWLEAPEAELIERVRQRRGDASDADADVVRNQFAAECAPVTWHRVDARGAPEDVLARAEALLREVKSGNAC
jgi:uncharacterized protein